MEIQPEDVIVDVYLAPSQRSQLIQTPKAIRLTHKPTGVVVISENGRSQPKNRSIAWSLLELCLQEVECVK